MPITDSDYNNFATAVTGYFTERCKGLDEDSERIVDKRPSDHILVGFLTPVKDENNSHPPSGSKSSLGEDNESEEEELANDLPQDAAHEQTALGLEWIAPIEQLTKPEVSFKVEFQTNIYVRRLPTLSEQRTRVEWNWKKKPEDPRTCNMIQVWSRHRIPPTEVFFETAELWNKRKLNRDVASSVVTEWANIDKTNLFPGRHAIVLEENDLQSPAFYDSKLAKLQSTKIPLLWKPIIDVRLVSIPTAPGFVRIALRVINQSPEIKNNFLDFVDPNLYAVQLKVTLPKELHEMTIFQELPASFRFDRRMYAVGINSHVDGTTSGNEVILTTDSTPTKRINRLEPQKVDNAEPLFDDLATNPIPILKRILAAMQDYDGKQWREKIGTLNNEVEKQDAEDARRDFANEITRFERGVNLLANGAYPNVGRAFSLMNRAMKKASRGKYDGWRLFQIIFIVSQLPGLAAREHPELEIGDDDKVEILWFAAGGGKTEGFLGLILFQAFFDRLRGKTFGVTAYVRFPLRLLAFQQLRRLARALAAAEELRLSEGLAGARFSIGDFVGGNVTPNAILDDDHKRFSTNGIDKRYQRIFECPFCDASVNLEYEKETRLIKHFCSNSKCKYSKENLPVYIVDTDIYRFLPTVIVSTVDKIALFGFNQRFANIFGRFDFICYKHGASFNNINRYECSAAKAFGEGNRPDKCDGKQVSYGPFYDPAPSLLIQDELHLLSQALGAFDAHYETAVMQLFKSLGHKPWKIIAATATIEEYDQHAAQLYLKRARQFPSPGPEVYESFYYRQEPDKIGRIFVGILGIGRKHTPSVMRALSTIYSELQRARDLVASDINDAIARYSTSPLTKKEFEQLIFLYELPLTYVLTRKGSDQVAEAIETRVKKDLQELSPTHGELKIEMFNSGVDISEMSETMHQISSSTSDGDPSDRLRGLVTTNIIGHGVDIDRFNIIVFAGFTRLVAEYIQASARVGRTYPGISIFVVTPQNERDRSIFDRFAKFHEYLDRLVDPSAITRWTEPALQRTIPGLLAGYLMGIASYRLNIPISTVEGVLKQHARSGAEALNEKEILEWVESSYGANSAPSAARYKERLQTWLSNFYRLILNAPEYRGGKPKGLGMHLGAMQSLRDVDEPAEVRPARKTDADMIRRLTNG
jgi:hypothetical protein